MLKRKKRKKNNTTKLSNLGFNFTLTNIHIQILIILLLLTIIQLLLSLIFQPKAHRITNLAKVYILSLESWNAYYILHAAVVETLLYNNTFSMWDGTLNTSDFYYKHRDFTKEYVLENISESLDYDLGRFTEKYRSDLTKVKKNYEFYQ